MFLVTLSIIVFMPLVVIFLVRGGGTGYIVGAILAIVTGVGVGVLVFTPLLSLPALELVRDAVELLLVIIFPVSAILIVAYPFVMIGYGVFLLLRRTW